MLRLHKMTIINFAHKSVIWVGLCEKKAHLWSMWHKLGGVMTRNDSQEPGQADAGCRLETKQS